MDNQPYHIPALLPQALEALQIRPDGTYIDATLGGGGHTRAIAQYLTTGQGRLFSFDQDIDAIKNAQEWMGADSPITLVHGNFRYLANFMRYHGVEGVDGILADLGVSFHHFDTAERGFSFRLDPEAPLDMRMNRTASRTADDLLAEADEQQLADIFKLYGELNESRRLARAIVKARGEGGIHTVGKLCSIAEPILNPRRRKQDLACVFQALRIVVNDEMGALQSFLEASLKVLVPGGRLAVITYHSLEDRLVKNFMRTGNVSGRAPQSDIYGRLEADIRPVGKPIAPDAEEVERNPRSRSARLRVAEKTAVESKDRKQNR